MYLEDVGLIVRACNTTEISYPLEGACLPSEFKVFYADTGLLISQLGDDVPLKILSGDISSYKGAIAENMVAAAYHSRGVKLYYYHAPSGSPEIDFLTEDEGEVVMIECKASNNRATGMKFVIASSKKYGKHKAVKYSDTNVGEGDGFVTLPLYAAGFAKHRQHSQYVKMVNLSEMKVPEGE